MLKQQITDDMKAAMKGGDKERLGVIRLILADIKRAEVDGRKDLDDAALLGVHDARSQRPAERLPGQDVIQKRAIHAGHATGCAPSAQRSNRTPRRKENPRPAEPDGAIWARPVARVS